ncbi:lipoyl synthase [Pasteuria penetrans]|uniref:lipoyl synthase n=1 Tax=Pasteuria penetrans TaxID=86005 RepID=UPI000F94B2C5|nr:lipoyl synthase [Pasteuria penetrans]
MVEEMVPGSRKPEWLKVRLSTNADFRELKAMMRNKKLNTVCEEARCPNIHACWSQRTATFMILGSVCTRACRFCAVHTGMPTELDGEEPERVAEAVEQMGVRYAVVTSVARDDLQDGGASLFAATIHAIRARNPQTRVEVLIPDFGGSQKSLQTVLDAHPDVLNHNIETVRRLTPRVRAKATYDRTLMLLQLSKRLASGIPTKSSIMLGVGETMGEVLTTLRDLRDHDVDIVTLGQYLQPTTSHLPIARYVTPAEFDQLRTLGMNMGFSHIESGPLVRSSYQAHAQADAALETLAKREEAGALESETNKAKSG